MSKPKSRPSQSVQSGIYKPEAIKDTADSLGITISDTVTSALASDVEYRIHQVIEEASRFMRHGRRTTLTTADIDLAMRTLNIEPLYGHLPFSQPSYRKALPFPQINQPGTSQPSVGPVYFVEDEEIDFERVLREEKVMLPKGVSWTAHWLAVEGVQPMIPENPPAVPREEPANAAGETKVNGALAAAPAATGAAGLLPGGGQKSGALPNASAQSANLVKQVLSRELQLYYARLTSALLPPERTQEYTTKKVAALASLRHDAGLQALLPYLVRWVGEGVVGVLKTGEQGGGEGKVLEVLMDVVGALLENTTLFVEPYLHQLLPPILSTLLHSTLPPSLSTHLRISASQTLSRVLTQHSTTYPSLSPRIMKTLLLALISPGKSRGTREGAVRGLMGVGKEAVRKGLVDAGGARVVASECTDADVEDLALVNAVMDALRVLQPASEMSDTLDMSNEEDAAIARRLQEALGDKLAERVSVDRMWAREVLGVSQAS
ncbi:TAF-domain-containing protein [Macrolepiota fuliginosa MF-IS2]|uniref:TAF-domain-containing protein n=1 Tax=Macrolepiota fuliginosa MF-IS2 TaxID=1400762 RepID=A0A9P5XHN6_9AGAR|nr:TAF-domain-containing protein [Macrolepiota fuliginosa MF-IS2]